MKRVIADIQDDKHAQFKSKAAADHVTMGEALNLMIDDYLSGKWKPRPQTKRGKAKA